MTDIRDDHLSAEEVLQLLDFMAEYDPIIVGGQSLNLWAHFYSDRDVALMEMGPFTSKDLDIFGNQPAAESLAANLADGRLMVAGLDDMTPNATVVTGRLGDRKIVVDFMASIMGVEDASIRDEFVGIAGTFKDREVKLLVMNPRDCLRSRLSNVNRLHREDAHSVNQAAASIRVLTHFLHDLLDAGDTSYAQKILHELQFVIRDEHLGKSTHRKFADRVDPFAIAAAFVDDDRLHERWRDLILRRWIDRERGRETRLARREGRLVPAKRKLG